MHEVAEDSGTMSFYAFESQWLRLRNAPARAALLRHIGAEKLPMLLRESLDADFLATVAEVLRSELAGEDSDQGDTSSFAIAVLYALSKTSRFDLSIHGLSGGERSTVSEVLQRLESHEDYERKLTPFIKALESFEDKDSVGKIPPKEETCSDERTPVKWCLFDECD